MGDMEENEQKWDKQEYLYRMFSHHTKDKEKENYVVNAIWQRLDDLNIKPVTQQYVHISKSNRYALIDLYFPQINYGVECDEATTRITSSKMPHAKSTCKQHCPPAVKTD